MASCFVSTITLIIWLPSRNRLFILSSLYARSSGYTSTLVPLRYSGVDCYRSPHGFIFGTTAPTSLIPCAPFSLNASHVG